MSLKECAELVKEVFLVDNVRVYGDLKDRISRVAVSPGSGSKMTDYAISCKADVLACGLDIIDAGHFGLEKMFVSYMKDYFKCEMPEMEVSAASQKEPFITV